MDRRHFKVGAVDVHRDMMQAACEVIDGLTGEVTRDAQRFSTTVSGVAEAVAWFLARGVTVVSMEATGVYWKPVYYGFEGVFEHVWVLNAQHVRNVPGRKTDLNDAQWLADVTAHGMVTPSFVPPPPIRALRDLTRYRKTLSDERKREIQRLEKVLQDASVKITSVASGVWSKSSRRMIEALITGERDPEKLAELALGKMRPKRNELIRALANYWKPHHSVMARQLIAHIDYLDNALVELSRQIVDRCGPFEELIERFCEIPGVGRTVAEIVVAETGGTMDAFATPQQLCAWAGVAPANRESAGKHKQAGTRHGGRWLRRALIESAQSVGLTKNSYLAARFQRIARRRGRPKAAVAVAHTILTIMWHLATTGEHYRDLGADFYERRRDPEREATRHVNALAKLGYTATLEPVAA